MFYQALAPSLFQIESLSISRRITERDAQPYKFWEAAMMPRISQLGSP